MGVALAPVERDVFAAADACYAGVVKFLRSGEAMALTESQIEREVERRGRELLRRLVQAHVDERGPGKAGPFPRRSAC